MQSYNTNILILLQYNIGKWIKKNKMMIFIIILLLHEDVSLLIVVLLAGKSPH